MVKRPAAHSASRLFEPSSTMYAQRSPWYIRPGRSGLSPMLMGAGAFGLLLIALGAILPELLDTWGFSLLLLPSGTLLCAGVAFLSREEDDTRQVYLGLGLVALGIAATNILAVQTSARFFGLRTASQLRVFRLPQWSELLTLHFGWTITAIVIGLGFSLVGRKSIERDISVGLALFCVFPLIGLLCYLITSIAT